MKGYIRRRGPSWELRVYLGRDPVSGRKRYTTRSVRGLKRAAERVLRDMVSAAEAGVTHRAGATFGELCETWLAHASGHLAANTVTETRRILDRTLLPRLGDVALAGPGPERQLADRMSHPCHSPRRSTSGGSASQTPGPAAAVVYGPLPPAPSAGIGGPRPGRSAAGQAKASRRADRPAVGRRASSPVGLSCRRRCRAPGCRPSPDLGSGCRQRRPRWRTASRRPPPGWRPRRRWRSRCRRSQRSPSTSRSS
jgi:Phage integrase, N-terminal SAM-like domain